MDSFAERRLPIDGKQFLSRTGTWICHLTSPVDLAPVDRRTFHLHFDQIVTDRRWTGPAIRTLELRTSAGSFATAPSYAPWLLLVVDGFLDSDEVDGLREAFEVERSSQS
jgi:hypothetical protein